MDLWVYRCECGTLHRVSADIKSHQCPDCGRGNAQNETVPEYTPLAFVGEAQAGDEPGHAVLTAPATEEETNNCEE